MSNQPISSSTRVSSTEIVAMDNTHGSLSSSSTTFNNSAAITTSPNESVNEENPKPISSSSRVSFTEIDNTNGSSSSFNNSAAIVATPNESVNEASPKLISSPSRVSSTEIVAINSTDGSSSSFNHSGTITKTPNESVDEASPKPISSYHRPKPKPKPKPKFSFWGVVRDLIAKRQVSSDSKMGNDGHTNGTNGRDEAELLRNWIDSDLEFMEKTSKAIEKYKNQIKEASNRFIDLKNDGSLEELRELLNKVTKLKQQISFENKYDTSGRKGQGGNANTSLDKTKLYKNPMFEASPAFQDFQLLYSSLDTELKLCLLCFSVFPEDAVIKKRLMVYWWIGEGFIQVPPIPAIGPAPKTEIAEELGNEFFNKLMVKGFIEPYYKKRSLEVHSCKMHPFVRSAVIMLAKKAKFFDFDGKGNVTGNFSSSLRACLLSKESIDIRQVLEHIHTVFNVDEPFIEFKLEWFLTMINVNVLYLGRWQDSATHHIEVVKTKFLEGLRNMRHLRFFSLQGVCRITKLPESISRLRNLLILDLRACHNLEVIPDGIGSLKSLTHLDMSGCYLLDQMPKGLASLSQLQVLKGFIVGKDSGKNSCTLEDLAKLRRLKKLCVYTTLKRFPADIHLCAFQQFQVLCKLTIAWGPDCFEYETDRSAKQAKDAGKLTAPDNMNQENKGTSQDKEDEKAKQAKDAGKSTAPDNMNNEIKGSSQAKDEKAKQAKDAGKSTAPDKINPENKGSSQAKEGKKAKQESGVLKTRAADTLTEEKKGGITKKGDSTAAEATAASNKPKLGRVATKRSYTFDYKLPTLPSQLKKLDLQCFPMNMSPSWLMPANLKGLEKLYVRGGKFSDLGQFQDKGGIVMPEQHKWNVGVLRLKYLNELEMDWRELQELFPKLIFLEKVKCPKLAFFPCDEKGVWINRAKK